MKIWSKLFLVAATGMMMFSSCLENIEPEGIKDLRGAKAELLRAQTALAEAQAAKVNADAAYVQAQAKIQEAIAKQEEAKVAYYEAQALLAQYEAEYQALENAAYEAEKAIELEQKMAEAQAAIAEAEALAAVYAAELERDLLYVQTEIANYQADLEKALKDLAIAKNSLTPEQLSKVGAMENAVNEARNGVEAKTVALENAARQLAAALAEVDEVKANRLNMRMAELKLAVAQAALEGKVKAEAEAKAALDLDPSVTDWEAKVEAYKAEIAKLDSEWYKKDAEIDEQMASMRDSAKTDGAIGKMAANYTGHTGYKFDEKTGYFSKIKGSGTLTAFDFPEIYVEVPENSTSTFTMPDSYTFGEEDEAFKGIDKVILEVSAYETYTRPYLERQKETSVENADAMPEAEEYVAAVEKYTDMVAAYKSGEYVAYVNKYEADEDAEYEVGLVEDAIKNYNDALKTFHNAFDTYVEVMATAKPDQALLETIEAEKLAAMDAAETAYLKAKNEALDAKNTAEAAYVKAKYAHRVKVQERDLAIENALYVAGFDVTEEEYVPEDNDCGWQNAVKSAVATMSNATAPTKPTAPIKPTLPETDPGYEDAMDKYESDLETYNTELTKYNKYQTALEEIAKAQTTYDDPKAETDPASVWAKAKTDWDTAENTTYKNAIATAKKNYTQAVDAAELAYENAVAEHKESLPKIDGEYKSYLKELALDYNPLKKAVSALAEVIKDVTAVDNPETVNFAYSTGDTGIMFSKVPGYFIDEDKRFVPIDVETILALVDEEKKLEAIKTQLESIFDFKVNSSEVINIAEYICDDYPLSYPTYEEYVDYVEATKYTSSNPQGCVALYYSAKASAEAIDPNEVDADTNKAYIAALEAAKVEMEKIIAENAAQLAADKAEVEAFYAKYLAADEKAKTELEVIKAKNDAVKSRYFAMIKVISEYCGAKVTGMTTVDDLVAALQASYESAVKDVIFAEEDVHQAEQAIEDVKAGIVTAADAAQRAYDRAAEELAEAIAKLERAAADLEAVIAAIYGEAEETPAE